MDQVRWSFGPPQWILQASRASLTAFQVEDSLLGKPMLEASFHKGTRPNQSEMSLSHVKKPILWRKNNRLSRMEKLPRLHAIGSKPIKTLFPEWILHLRFIKKYFSAFLKLSQMADPFLVPISLVLYQYSRFLPFKYFCFKVTLHGPSPNIPL